MQFNKFWRKNGGAIVSCLAAAGVIATAFVSAKTALKINEIVEETNNIDKMEIVKTAAPAIILTSVTVGCIFAANVLNKRHFVALNSAYITLDQSFKEYQRKVKEIHGEKAHQDILDSLAVEKAQKVDISGIGFFESTDLLPDDLNSEPMLFYLNLNHKEFKDRYFESTIERVMNAEYHLNRNYTLRGYATLEEFLDFLGLKSNMVDDILGWAVNDDELYWIDFNHRKVQLEDGLECIVIEVLIEPSEDWQEYY